MIDNKLSRAGPLSAGRLEASERRYRRLFESAHDGILILDAVTGKILDVNPFLLTLLGYEEKELLGKQPWEIGIFADIEANKAALKELQTTGAIRYENLPLRTKNHEQQIDVEVVSNVYQEGDRAVIQCNIRDIRTRKAASDVLLLEAHRVKRMKDEYFAMVSHELRTPLQAVLGWTQMLQRSIGNPGDLAAGLDAIARSTQAQARLVDDLLDISRIVFGKLTCDCKPVDLLHVLSETVDDELPAAAEKQIQLQLTCSTSDVTVNGDSGRLFQIFANLLSNAIKFTPAGGKIDVVLQEKNTEVEVRIRDTGMGISPTLLPWIFDRFRQSETPALRKHRGLGLGLAIAKELVILQAGTLHAESEGEGKGSTFIVTLPLASKCVASQ